VDGPGLAVLLQGGFAAARACCAGASLSLSASIASVSSISALSEPASRSPAVGASGARCDAVDMLCFPARATVAAGAAVCFVAEGLTGCAGFSGSRALTCGALLLGGAFAAAPNENMEPAPVLGRITGGTATDGGFAVLAGGSCTVD
jgi:hypothetical protein